MLCYSTINLLLTIRRIKNEEIEIVCGNETNVQKSTQSDIFIHVLMSQSQSIESGDQINANICFFHFQ